MEVKYNSFENELAKYFKCLSNPAKISIIILLSKYKTRNCSEIVEELPLSQSTVSKHLNDLLEIKLICRKITGKTSNYTLEWNTYERFISIIERLESKTMKSRPKKNCC
jgi:ArsR family transcriptional regulator, arsenate/arsenite/antimonite-responsive transcriptional repressor